MSDTVKLIIEIPEKMYEQIKDGAGETRYKIPLWLCHSIFYGTTLDDVKAEITALRYGSDTYKYAIDDVIEILDNITKESEDKE